MRFVEGFLLIGVLLASMLMPALALNIQSPTVEVNTSTVLSTNAKSRQGYWDDRLGGSNRFAAQGFSDLQLDADGHARLIVGVDSSKGSLHSLERLLVQQGANVTDTISIGNQVRAVAVEVLPDRSFFLTQQLQTSGLASYVEPDVRVNVSYTPDDPYWSNQWAPQKIGADLAWDTTNGSSSILVAIVDTGIDYNHPELAANYAPLGYDWVNNDTDPLDDYGHGTHCAGIVAAAANNGIGVAGLAQVHIMAEKVLSSSGWGWDSWVAEGISHAADVGANIISLSLGAPEWSDLMFDAVNYARNRGALIIAAAGNEASDQPFYPAAYDGVVAVSATDSNDNLASFSNFGNWITVAAPGVDILSTMPTYHVAMNDAGYDMNYAYASGTSMACPHVAGVAALAWSEFRNSSADQIRWIMENTADKLGFEGHSEQFGYGRVNAEKAVSASDHDVGIVECEHPGRVDPGSLCTFNVVVGNFGKENETNVIVQLSANGSLVESATVASSASFSSTTIALSWSPPVVGRYDITCYVVPVLDENATQNNAANYVLLVRFASTLRVRSDYQTIKEALNCSANGDTILVSAGYYDEGEIDVRVDNITLIADGNVLIDGRNGFCAVNIMADFVTLEGFDIRNCPYYGVRVRGHGDVLTRNVLIGNGEYGESLHVYGSSGCTLSQNYVEASSNGVYIIGCSNSTVTSNRLIATSRFSGMHVSSCTNVTVSFNYILNSGYCWDGLEIIDSENNTIVSNTVKGFSFGLVLSSSNNLLRNNTLINNFCNFCPWGSSWARTAWSGPSDVDNSNTADGKPICYWVNVSNSVVPSGVACVVLVNCENITVQNLQLRNNDFGVCMINSSNILVENNNFTADSGLFDPFSCGVFSYTDSYNITVIQNNATRNDNGILLWGYNNTVAMNVVSNNMFQGIMVADNSTVAHNNVTFNEGPGVFLRGSGCTVTSNNIMANTDSGIRADGSNHTITLNNIIGNAAPDIWIYRPVGIRLSASGCNITLNNILDCAPAGGGSLGGDTGPGGGAILTYLGSPSNNTIFHNNFVNNAQDLINSANSNNTWDAGYPAGGNYWSTYNGSDADGDGLGDTPYTLDSNNLDNYPLMQPCPENLPPQTFTLRVGWFGNSTEAGYYERPLPPPGTYIFTENSIIHVDMLRDSYTAVIDFWELDSVNIGSAESVDVLMDSNHTLTLNMHEPQPLNVSITPTNTNIYSGEQVPFNSSLSSGKPPYDYQWFVNGTMVWDATSPDWIFRAPNRGILNVTLIVRYPFEIISEKAGATTSNIAWINVSGISASVSLDATILNLKSRGDWITAIIELPEGYNVSDINVATVALNDTVFAESNPAVIEDHNNNSVFDLVVKFDRTHICEFMLAKGIISSNVTVEITWQLNNETAFTADCTLKVSSQTADIDCDGKVLLQDLVLLAGAYGSKPGDPKWNPNANIAPPWDSIGLADLVVLAMNYGLP